MNDQVTIMKTSDAGIAMIKKFEGIRLDAYQCHQAYDDGTQVWTIGYGHTQGVKQGQRISEQQAEAFLRSDLATAEKAVNAQNLKLTQNQFDSFVSLTFNIGAGAFAQSTALRLAKANPNDPEIAAAIKMWNKAGGKVNQGLVNRREVEAANYFKK
jgi:lysozyme